MYATHFILLQNRTLIRMGAATSRVMFYTPAASVLMAGTAAHESGGFTYWMQHDFDADHSLEDTVLDEATLPAMGPYGMEPSTHDDLIENFLVYRPAFASLLESFCPPKMSRHEALTQCLAYATAACRLQYFRKRDRLPAPDDLAGMEAYHKKHWNTAAGKTKPGAWIRDYERYCIQVPDIAADASLIAPT